MTDGGAELLLELLILKRHRAVPLERDTHKRDALGLAGVCELITGLKSVFAHLLISMRVTSSSSLENTGSFSPAVPAAAAIDEDELDDDRARDPHVLL